ncbi:hypothetical protein Cni_G28657 [Canna indica]|uniref:Thiol-disulfide oxidoreductase DCC n=1 Tax=Canna indica TaxID=4628 RepID=A0AAQ3L3R8_9LILI|nr:hypothetical protein Cni_G28657 [Canna indica]
MMRRVIFRRLSSATSSSAAAYARYRLPPSSLGSRFASPAPAGVVDVFDDNPLPPPKVAAVPTLLQPRVVIYDGVCHLCHRGVKWIIKKDEYQKIKFCCVQSKTAEPYLRLCGVDRDDVLRRFLFIEGPGAYYEGSTAALKVASYLPWPYSALSAMMIIPAPLRDVVYDYVAKHRYNWFGKEDECIVMREKELLDRFVDRHEML